MEISSIRDLVDYLFPDNVTGKITPADARTLLDTVLDYLENLGTNQVRGSRFLVPFIVRNAGIPTVPTSMIPARSRILGMEVLALNGVDAGEAQAGLRADPITFQLIAHSTGTIAALVDALDATTQTVLARWVRTSGTDEEKMVTYPVLVLEDHPYKKGDVVQYTFEDLVPPVTRLEEWRANSVGFAHPLPTGLDDDPIYKPFAPLVGGSTYDDTAIVQRLKTLETAALAGASDFSYVVPLAYTQLCRDWYEEESRITTLKVAEGISSVRLALGAGPFTTYTAAQLAALTPLLIPAQCPLRWQAISYLSGYNEGTIYVAGKKV